MRALFPHDTNEDKSVWVCRATHKRVGTAWVVMAECGKIELGKSGESYQRHIKTVHLGDGQMSRKGMSLLSWIKGMRFSSLVRRSF